MHYPNSIKSKWENHQNLPESQTSFGGKIETMSNNNSHTSIPETKNTEFKNDNNNQNNNKSYNKNNKNKNNPRSFDKSAKKKCWDKADVVPGRHPERWRKDAAGNIVCKRLCMCSGCLCFEYDHIVPFSKGGESTSDNCQILQTRVNRYKADKEVDPSILRGYSCDLKFTEKELDVIEMAVYGDVIRPGNQCRCRSMAELLGTFKSKDRMEACKLPYGEDKLSS